MHPKFTRRRIPLAAAAMAAAALLLAGCSKGLDAKIDASDESAYEASVQSVEKSMSDAERAQFAAALREVEWSAADPQADERAAPSNPRSAWIANESLEQAARRAVDGKTGRQIVAAAQSLANARQNAQAATLGAEIQRLRKNRDDRQQKQALLDQIQVDGGQWVWDDALGFGRLTLKLSVANKTSQPLSSIDLAPGLGEAQEAREANAQSSPCASAAAGASAASAPAAAPCVAANRAETSVAAGARAWRVELAPPLAAGETRAVALAVNPYSSTEILTPSQEAAIRAAKAQPQDLSVENAIGANGVKIAPDFSAADQDRLARLERQEERQKKLVESLAKAPDSK